VFRGPISLLAFIARHTLGCLFLLAVVAFFMVMLLIVYPPAAKIAGLFLALWIFNPMRMLRKGSK
jgi:hypothetical protein